MAKKTQSAKKLTAKDLQHVQDHYLDYPYPHRNPEDDKKRLMKIYADTLAEISHWLFKGKESFKNGFRILVAGGGTGDSTVFLAEQLKDTNAEIVYLDFSKNSMAIAQMRAKNRGLTNIKWINDSIFNLPKLKLGQFDFINCIGVLHHLESPDDGLKILQQALKPNGGMNIMVYAQIGRTGVYHIQEMMRMVNRGEKSRQQEVKNGWTMINALPNTNWYSRGKELLQDHIHHGDVGMYDMFLHKQDRAYTVPELYEFVEKAGLNFVDFNSCHSRLALRIENYVTDPELLAKLQKLKLAEQQGIAEIMTGNIIKHSIYISNAKNVVASFDDLNNVPYFYTIQNLAKTIHDYIEANPAIIGKMVAFSWDSELAGKLNLTFPVAHYTKYLYKHLISEDKSLKEIFDLVRKDLDSKVTDAELLTEFKKSLLPLQDAGALLLRDKSVGPYPTLFG
jgi:ubiquinone/menaquinone biosynthesis C-methylase UbiE